MDTEAIAKKIMERVVEFCNQTSNEAIAAIDPETDDMTDNRDAVRIAANAMAAEDIFIQQSENLIVEIKDVLDESHTGDSTEEEIPSEGDNDN